MMFAFGLFQAEMFSQKSHEWVWGSSNNMSTSYNPKNNKINLFNEQKMVHSIETAIFADVGCIKKNLTYPGLVTLLSIYPILLTYECTLNRSTLQKYT